MQPPRIHVLIVFSAEHGLSESPSQQSAWSSWSLERYRGEAHEFETGELPCSFPQHTGASNASLSSELPEFTLTNDSVSWTRV